MCCFALKSHLCPSLGHAAQYAPPPICVGLSQLLGLVCSFLSPPSWSLVIEFGERVNSVASSNLQVSTCTCTSPFRVPLASHPRGLGAVVRAV